MKKNIRFITASIAVMMLLCLVLACNNDTPQPVSYSTPTATGRISLPPSSGLTNDSIHLLVYETGYQGKVNADGTWLISGLEAGKSYTVFFQDKPFVDLSRSLSPDTASFGARKANVMGATEAGYDNGMVQIKATATVNGSVTSEGHPVSDVTVSIPGTPYVAQSDGNGEFTLAGLSDGTYDIAFNRRGYVDTTYEAFSVITETSTSRSYELDPLELAPAAGTIRGSVSFEGSSSVGNRSASVSVYSNDNPSSSRSVFTDSTGQFVIDGLAAGTYTVTISSTASYRPVTINDVVVSEAGSTTLEPVMLSAIGGRIYGRVSSAGDSAFTSALITLTSTTGDEVYYRPVGRTEDYAIEDIIPGTYSYTVECDTYATISGTLKVTVGSDEKFDFILEAIGGSVNGRVILDGNWTNSGAKVRIANINDTTKTYETTTASDGSFTIDNIRYEGAYRVSVTADNYVSAQDITVDVKFGERTTISDTITLKPVAGIVKGNVIFADAQVHGGIQLILRNSSYMKESTTENGGNYIFESVQPGTYQLLIQADGYVERTFANIVVQQSEIVEIEPVVLDRILMPLSGKVILEGGQPAVGVLVNAVNLDNAELTYSTMTGDDGTYEIREMAVGTYRLTFSLDEYDAYETNVAMEPGRNAVADATLSLRYGSLAGAVVLEGQEDASGVTITLIGENGSYATESGEDGSYSITQIEPGLYNATFAKLGYLTRTTSCVITAGKGYELSPTLDMVYAIITGKVVLSDGNDPSGVTVTAKSLSDSSETYSAKAEADGSFNIVDIRAEGRYQLTASCDGYSSYNSGSLSVVMGEVTEVEEITLSSLSGSLSGTLKLDASLSHDGIKIVLSNDEASYEATSDVDGSFRIPAVSPGTYALTASCEGYIDRSVTGIIVTQGQETRLEELTLSQTRLSLTGTIKLEDASDHSGVLVTLAKEGDGETLYSAVTIADGTYSIGNIIPGEYVLTASRTGYSEYTTKVVLAAGRDYSEDATLKAGSGIISGHVYLSGASDYSDITVSVVNSRNPEVSHQTTTSADGTFSITGVRTEGLYLVTASKDGYVTDSSTSVTVKFGTTATVEDITLARMDAVVKGRVLFSGLSSHEGIEISLENDDYNLSATTDSNGEFVIREVAPGTYRLTASADGYVSRTVDPVVVAQSATVTVEDITLAKEVLPLNGTVTLEGLGDYSNTLVTATSTTDEELVYSTYTDESGKYTIESMKVGSYELTISHDGYESYTTRITVVGGLALNVDAELELGSGIISGHVFLSGASDYSGITITATLSSDSSTKYSTTTGADGSFSITGVGTEGLYLVTASRDGYVTDSSTSVTVKFGTTATVDDITLGRMDAVVKGRALFSGLSAHEGIEISLENDDYNLSATTDSNGEFVIKEVAPGTYRLTASADGYASRTIDPVVVAQSATVTVEDISLVKPVLPLSGTVTLEGLSDYSGTRVIATSTTDEELVYSTYTDESGKYTIESMQVGSYELTFSHDGYVAYTTRITVIGGDAPNVDAELELGSGIITGTVLLEGASDYSGITVTATLSSDSSTKYSATTTADGLFLIVGINKAGTYLITVSKTGFNTDSTRSVSVVPGQVSSIGTLTLYNNSATIRGIAQLEEALSHEGIKITLQDRDGELSYSAITDAEGEYIITGITPGRYYTVSAAKAGYSQKRSAELYISESDDLSVDTLVLPIAVMSLTGTVDIEDADDYGAIVRAENLLDASLTYTAVTNSSGVFTLVGMQPGQYQVTISLDGYRTVTLETVEVVSENGTIQLEDTIILPAAKGTLIGFARLEGLSDHSGITVQILDTSYSTTTAEDGSFSLPVVPGVYTNGVTFSKEDYETAGQTISLTVESDKTYPIGDVTLECLAAPVMGKVDVLLTDDDSGVTVSIDGTEFTMLTGSDGTFSFEHVPVGSYSLILERENVADVTVGLTVAPGKGADLGTITLVPNSASIYGTVMLDGLDNHSFVDVTAVPSDGSISQMIVLSEASGYFHMGNLLSTSDYTVTFSKTGWDSQSIEVSGLTPLEEREVTADSPITLKDTTAPVLNAVTINDGANTTSERTVQITLDAFDYGSRLAKMQYCYDGVFDRTVTMRDYQGSFKLELPGDNGDKTLYVKVFDTSGNESGVMSATVTLIDQIKEVEGVLSGDDLHWTKDQSPYLVTGNVLVPKGETLIIDPGVDVQFNGEFYMQVEGAIQAIGTESERIKIYGVGEGVDRWTGIRVQFDNGSLFDYVDVYDSYRAIEGYADVSNSSIESAYSNSGSYSFYGDMTNVTMDVGTYDFTDSTLDKVSLTSDGIIYVNVGVTVKNSELEINGELSSSSPLTIIDSTVSGVGSISSSPLTIIDSTVSGVWSISSSGHYSPLTIMNSTVSGVGSISSSYSPLTIMNSTVSGVGSISSSGYNSPLTIMNSTVSGFESISSTGAMKIVNTILTDIGQMSGFENTRINNSNMYNCGTLRIWESRSDRTTVDLRGNFWGYDKTREFNEAIDGDVSFIEDYFDDFSRSRGDYSGYLEEPIGNIGVMDEDFVPTPPSGVSYEIGDIGPGGGLVMCVDTEDVYPDFDYIEVLDAIFWLPFGFYRVDGVNTEVGTSEAVGAGDENTAALVDAMGEYTTFTDDSDDDIEPYAAGLAYQVKAGGYDWYLPSSGDAELIAQSGLIEDDFWTSTEYSETAAYYWHELSGHINNSSRESSEYITVCRYF